MASAAFGKQNDTMRCPSTRSFSLEMAYKSEICDFKLYCFPDQVYHLYCIEDIINLVLCGWGFGTVTHYYVGAIAQRSARLYPSGLCLQCLTVVAILPNDFKLFLELSLAIWQQAHVLVNMSSLMFRLNIASRAS